MPTKTSRIPRNLNFRGETAFWGGIFCLEYPSKRSEKVNCHFVNYRFSFRKLQIFISFRSISFRFAPFRFANYSKPSPCCHPSRRNWFNYHIWFPRLDRKPTSFLVQFALICTFFFFLKTSAIYSIHNILCIVHLRKFIITALRNMVRLKR